MLRQGAQHALLLCAEAWRMLARAQHNALDALLHAVLAGAVLPVRRLARRVRVWHGWLERRGCRSTPRRMCAAEAAQQAAGIAAAESARPLLCFRPRFTTTFGFNFRFIIAAELYLAVSL